MHASDDPPFSSNCTAGFGLPILRVEGYDAGEPFYLSDYFTTAFSGPLGEGLLNAPTSRGPANSWTGDVLTQADKQVLMNEYCGWRLAVRRTVVHGAGNFITPLLAVSQHNGGTCYLMPHLSKCASNGAADC
jgi:hypothetical protein